MALDRLFAESIVNRDDHVVLGRRLLPLSLWHLLMLEIAGSPYFAGGTFPLAKDLRLAVAVCTTRFPRLPDLSGRRLAWDWLRSWRCRFLVETAKFRSYLEDFNAPPMLWEKEKTDKPKGAPSVPLPHALEVATFLIGHGFTEERAWTMPAGLAQWYYVAIAKQKGCEVNLVSPGEQKAIDELKTRRAQRAAQP